MFFNSSYNEISVISWVFSNVYIYNIISGVMVGILVYRSWDGALVGYS